MNKFVGKVFMVLLSILLLTLIITRFLPFEVKLNVILKKDDNYFSKQKEKQIRSYFSLANKRLQTNKTINDEIELTIRMPGNRKMVKRVMCDILRSAVLFWSPNYGKLHFILDESDKFNHYFPNNFAKLNIPFNIRFTYEKLPTNVAEMTRMGTIMKDTLGYTLQLYSSFLMDLYTDAKVIAWTDTDTIFTQPVLKDSVVRNGKLVVKGMNHFNKFPHLPRWDKINIKALGLPMVSDFMTYFPVYMFPSTIKHCREFIIKRFNVTTLEEAFYLFTTDKLSPVSIIMSYAYYFERNLYEWHIDVGPDTLPIYNKKRLPNHPLTSGDVLPELHVTVHSGYYKSVIYPLHQSICYIQIIRNKSIIRKSCQQFVGKSNLQLFEFCLGQHHLDTWCKGEGRRECVSIVDKQYERMGKLYQNGKLIFNTSLVKYIENIAKNEYDIQCPNIKSL